MWIVVQLKINNIFPKSITSNMIEGMNHVYKQITDWKLVTLDRLILTFYHLQGYYINEVERGYCGRGTTSSYQNKEKRKPLSQSELADQLLNEHRVKLDDFTVAVQRKLNFMKLTLKQPKANCATLRKAFKSAAGIKMLGKKKPTEWDKENKKVSVVKKKTTKPCNGKKNITHSAQESTEEAEEAPPPK
ncbi:unnamed protein product, partial [Didymodactylos carnosus]